MEQGDEERVAAARPESGGAPGPRPPDYSELESSAALRSSSRLSASFDVRLAARASSPRASSIRPTFASRSPRTLGSRWYDFSDGSPASSSTSSSPASGPYAIPTATARFSSTTGDGTSCDSASYSATIVPQSVSAATGARAWQAAIAAWSPYGPSPLPSA